MRPQQQNRRMRGRNNNNSSNGGNNNNNSNRKGPNPLTRSYESNGPDVKIRGSAQQVAEKYMQLARDAQSSGDRVMAENYLQHAEHYNRIIFAAQAQMPVQQNRDNRDDMDGDDEDRDDFDNQSGFDQQRNNEPQQRQTFDQQQPRQNDGTGPQPTINGMPAEVVLSEDGMPGGEQPHDMSNGVNGNANGAPAQDGEEGAQRRPRRPRRRRSEFENRANEAGAVADGVEPADAGNAAEQRAVEADASDPVA